ncbi:MAG: type VI secretion system membrane subunit TssM [Telluria sp.]
MKKLLGLVFNRSVLVLLGLLALALLVWLAGPLVAVAGVRPLETARARQVLIALLLGGYAAARLWKLLAARRANTRLLDAVLGHQAPPAPAAPLPGAAEVAQLEQGFAQAAAVLKKARFAKAGERAGPWGRLARQYLYELPWYLLVGSPGSGKTTALASSGLQFPLAGQMGIGMGLGPGPIRGVGGTRNCDWWFSDEAVLLDTAGRYTTQDSDRAADSAAWSGFLRLLGTYRKRRPIDGVLLTLSVAELLEQSPAEQGAHIEALRTRIEELHRELGIRFPLYVLVTKTDLLAGFTDFFAELTREERAQVWGTTLPYGEQGAPAGAVVDFDAEFAALEERLNARLIDRMQQERDPERRARLYVFPQQFAALRQSLQDFLAALFAPSQYTEKVLLRGVYFTSATQEGTPIDRVLARLGRALQLPGGHAAPQPGGGKSFFLTGLLREVVFREAGLAGVNLRWERRRAWLQWGALGAALLLAGLALGAWTLSYHRNRAYVEAVAAARDAAASQVAATGSGGADLAELLPVLAAVQHVADVPGGDAPLSMDFGLYQGDKLQAAARQAYRTLLQDAFLPRLAARIEQQLRSDALSNPELLYEGLKAYLMLHDPRHRDPAALKDWISADWEARPGGALAPAQRAALEGHLDALLAQAGWRPAAPADAALVATARDAIARTPLAQRIYRRLQRQAPGGELPEFTIAGAAGPAAALVFTRSSGAPLTRGIPGLYSVDGYYRVFAAASERVTAQLADEQPWVLGAAGTAELADPGARARLLGEVRRLYLDDYARRWEEFVGDIALVRATSLQQSIELARILSAPASPLPLLLRAIVKEVTLVPPEAGKPATDQAGERSRSARDELLKLFGQERQAAPAAPPGRPDDVVDRRFDELRRLVQAPPGAPAPIDNTVKLINELYALLTATEAAVRSGNTPPPSEVPNRIRAEGRQMPEPVRSLLLGLSEGGASQSASATRANLSQALQSGVFEFCNKAIGGRYPFTRESARDVTQEDFARLFAPAGVIDDFFQKNLAPFVNTATRPWSFRDLGAASLGVGSGALLQFQRAQAIREVFFRPGAPGPSIRLELKPLELDPGVGKLALDVDGQLIEYGGGPPVPKQVQWPGPRGSNQVRLEISPPAADAPPQVFEGPWALQRMFDQARIERGAQPEQFVATFDLGGRKVRFRVASSSVQNPLRLPELEQFRCPGRL